MPADALATSHELPNKRRHGSPNWHDAASPSGTRVQTRRLSPNAGRFGVDDDPPPRGFVVTPEQVHEFLSNLRTNTHHERQQVQAAMLQRQEMSDEDRRKTRSEFESREFYLIRESEAFVTTIRGEAEVAIQQLQDDLMSAQSLLHSQAGDIEHAQNLAEHYQNEHFVSQSRLQGFEKQANGEHWRILEQVEASCSAKVESMANDANGTVMAENAALKAQVAAVEAKYSEAHLEFCRESEGAMQVRAESSQLYEASLQLQDEVNELQNELQDQAWQDQGMEESFQDFQDLENLSRFHENLQKRLRLTVKRTWRVSDAKSFTKPMFNGDF